MPAEFIIFGATLLGVALAHKHSLWIGLAGLALTIAYKLTFTGFETGHGVLGLAHHFAHEWVILANLMLLLVGFAVVAHHFEASKLPHALPRFLPKGWIGGLALLAMVFVLSIFLDNIAAAVIGGVVAQHVYRGKVGVGFLASLVAAANAGGAGSVVGDTTTTMLWLSGISPLKVVPAFLGSLAALCVFGVFGALAQHRHAPSESHVSSDLVIDWPRVVVVAFTLLVIITANISTSLFFPGLEDVVPILGLAIWIAILVSMITRPPDWKVTPSAAKGGLFLVSLVAIASLMPVKTLPEASWTVTLGLGALSSIFDNIPLTALTIQQGGYDWALVAYAVGFGGSMVWFGSSAGVALTDSFPQGRSVTTWLRAGWHVPVAYVVGFFVMLAVRGWSPG